MKGILKRLWNDDCGAILSAEWTMMSGVLLGGTVAGMVAVRDSVNEEMRQQAQIIHDVSAKYRPNLGIGDQVLMGQGSTIATVPAVYSNLPAQ